MAEPAAPAKRKRTPEEVMALKRKIAFTPCATKEDLHKWIRLFFGSVFDVPNCIVDPDSTSSPMDMIWECYSKGLANNDKSFARVMYYASRDSFKTLCAAMLEVLAIIHLRRNVAHMAAIEPQSEKSQEYVKKFFGSPVLRDYISGDNVRRVEFARYVHPDTGESIPESKYKALSPELRDLPWEEVRNYIKIVICTPAGANSEHVPFFVVDEVDVVQNERAYQEAKFIPAPINNIMPLTMLTSTRKISTGLVQREIDEAVDPETGVVKLHVRHWNILDVTRACEPERHLPDESKIPIYVNPNLLKAVSEEKWKDLSESEQNKYVKEEGFAGCLKNCRIFAACHGRLATHQKSQSPLLKPIEHVTNMMNAPIDYVLAQLLCKKPSSEGLVYPNFAREKHVVTAAQMAEMILGFPVDPRLDKKGLIEIMRQRDMLCYAGMDFGYAHNFACVTFFCDGYRAFVVDVIAEPELLPDQMVKICNDRVKEWNPVIFPDMENKQMIAVLRRAGFRMREWQKVAGTVVGGISVVQLKLQPPMSEPLLYFLAGDPGVEFLVKRLMKYHWIVDAAGRVTDRPTEIDDDECDALRYGIMNVFSADKGRPVVAGDGPSIVKPTHPAHVYTVENWMSKVIEERGGHSEGSAGSSGRRGRFGWVI